MARAAPFTMRYAVAVCCTSGAAEALLAMCVLPSSCARSVALKAARGRPRSSLATRASLLSGAVGVAPSRRLRAVALGALGARMDWMARSSCSLRFGLGIGCTRPILLLGLFACCFGD